MKKRMGFLLSAMVIFVSAALVGCQGGKTTESRQTGNTCFERVRLKAVRLHNQLKVVLLLLV